MFIINITINHQILLQANRVRIKRIPQLKQKGKHCSHSSMSLFMNLPCSLGLGDGLDDPMAAKQKESHPNWHSGGYAYISQKAQHLLLNATVLTKPPKPYKSHFTSRQEIFWLYYQTVNFCLMKKPKNINSPF